MVEAKVIVHMGEPVVVVENIKYKFTSQQCIDILNVKVASDYWIMKR